MGETQIMTGSEAKAFLEEVYHSVCAPGADPEISQRYFTDDFVHVIDGSVFSRNEFEAHLATLRAEIKTFSFDFTTVIAEGNRLADVHLFTATRKDGGLMKMKFIGVYTLRGGKIAKYEELTRLIEGPEEDRNYGSRAR